MKACLQWINSSVLEKINFYKCYNRMRNLHKWLTSLCVGAWGHPVTSSQLTSSICQGQSGSGHYQVHHWGLVWVYISSISLDGGLLNQAEWWGIAGAVPVSFGVTDCAWGGMYTVGVFHGVQSIAAGWGVAGATHCAGCTVWVVDGCVV